MPGVPPARYAYLGPAGTFTEEALRSLPAAAGSQGMEPCASVPAALDQVHRGDATAAMVPIENSVEGAVAVTLDQLATGEPLVITREVLLPIRFILAVRRGTDLADVRVLATHPHAVAQCRSWLATNLPDAHVIPAASTAAAAEEVAGDGQYDAAVASPLAVEHYGLEVAADHIGDRKDAVTRFVLVCRPSAAPPPTGTDRTSLVAFIRDDHPGALLEILTEFTVRGVNLTRIDSRPTGNGHGRYCFSIDCEGHVIDDRVGEALSALRRICADVRYLGSYPRADEKAPTVRGGTTDADYRNAAAWLTQIRAGRV